MPAIALAAASGILPGCREKLKPETVGGVWLALPAWPEHGRLADPANGYVDRRDPRGDRAAVAWDMDPRPGPVSLDEARLAAAMPDAEETGALQIAGHPARLLRAGDAAAAVWRCDKTARLLRVTVQGPTEVAKLAAHVRCHAVAPAANGEVPAAAGAVLGAGWRFGNRSKGSVSWLRDDAVLTYFAGQQLAGPRDPEAARKAAPAWAAAAGLQGAAATDAQPAAGPQGHPAILVRGTAALDGRPVRWSLLFWRCLQRQKSFAAIVFSQTAAEDGALLSARCHSAGRRRRA
jgi:hypothetical protein